ncbi:hypothetical protein HMI56_006123 [Coelomomyces lativittatus]|nr:hypothetical protein HMI56_006123 [Coelomomyces lativittatus]
MNLSSSLLTSLSTKKDKSSLPSPPMTASSSSFSTTSEPFSSSTTSLLTATTTTTSTSTTTATLPPPPPPPSVLPFSSSFNFIPVSDHLGAAALLSFCSTPSSNLDPSCQTFPSPLHGISNLTTTNRSSSSCSSSSSSSPHLSNLNRKNSSASSSSSSSMSLITPPTSISPFSSPPAWSPHSLIHASTFTHTTTTADTTHPSLERSLESSVPENAMSSLEIKGDQRRSSPLIKKEMDLDKNKETKMETKVPSSSFTPSSSSSSSLLYPTTTLSPLKTNSSSSSLPSNELTASLFTLPSKEEPSLIHLCPKEDSKTLEEEEKVKEDCSLSNSSSLLLAPLKEPAILENPVKKILDSFIHIKTCEYRSKQLGSIVDSGDFPCTCTYDHAYFTKDTLPMYPPPPPPTTTTTINTGWLFNETEQKKREEQHLQSKLQQKKELQLFLLSQAKLNPRHKNTNTNTNTTTTDQPTNNTPSSYLHHEQQPQQQPQPQPSHFSGTITSSTSQTKQMETHFPFNHHPRKNPPPSSSTTLNNPSLPWPFPVLPSYLPQPSTITPLTGHGNNTRTSHRRVQPPPLPHIPTMPTPTTTTTTTETYPYSYPPPPLPPTWNSSSYNPLEQPPK